MINLIQNNTNADRDLSPIRNITCILSALLLIGILLRSKTMKSELTQARLKELMEYSPTTGLFIRKKTTSNRANVGDVAGTISNGYIRIKINHKIYMAHRLAWFYVEGFFPTNIDIDHINMDRADNRWANLRLVSRSCNMRNSGNSKTNTSGVKGVYFSKDRNKWQSYITVNKKNKKLRPLQRF